MWTVVYLAQSEEEAEKIKNAMVDQGVLVKTRSVCRSKSGQAMYEILVPQAEVEDAYNVLTSVIY